MTTDVTVVRLRCTPGLTAGIPSAYLAGAADGLFAGDGLDVEILERHFADLLPRGRQSGIDVRAIPVGADVYASGPVAGDHVPDELAARMRDGLATARAYTSGHGLPRVDPITIYRPELASAADRPAGEQRHATVPDGPPDATLHDKKGTDR